MATLCRAVHVGGELLHSCVPSISQGTHGSAASQHPIKTTTTASCALQPGCCIRHPRDPDCTTAIVDQKNRMLISKHPDLGEGSAIVRFDSTPAQPVVNGKLPTSVRQLLTIVQGHRQTLEYGLQAALFSASASSRSVDSSDLLLHCNNVALRSATLLPSLEMAMRGEGYFSSSLSRNSISWSDAQTPVPREIEPRAIFDRMFRAGESQMAQRSVLDMVIADARRMKNSASVQDRQKIDE